MKEIFRIVSIVIILIAVVNFNSVAQKKSDFESQINTTTMIFSVILEMKDDNGNDLGMLDIQIVDRINQLVNVKSKRLNDQVKGNDPIRPKLKLIAYPEIDGRTYRLAESMSELKMEVDNDKVLLVDYMIILEAMRVKYF